MRFSPPTKRRSIRLHEAEAEHAETTSWRCLSCDRMVEEERGEAAYCRYCEDYWNDVANGLFDREDGWA
jgi:hypothetical protein